MEIKHESRILLIISFNHAASFHLFLFTEIISVSTLVLRASFSVELLIDAVESEQTTIFFGKLDVYLNGAEKLKNKVINLSSMLWWIYDDEPITTKVLTLLKKEFKTYNLVSINKIAEDDD